MGWNWKLGSYGCRDGIHRLTRPGGAGRGREQEELQTLCPQVARGREAQNEPEDGQEKHRLGLGRAATAGAQLVTALRQGSGQRRRCQLGPSVEGGVNWGSHQRIEGRKLAVHGSRKGSKDGGRSRECVLGSF